MNSGFPLVTIVTAVRNNVRDLPGAIESVAAQTYPYVEHVVIDGASTDGTVDVVRAHQHLIARWISEPDHGIYEAFNKGLRMAQGQLIGILNSDDRLEPYAVQRVVAAWVDRPSVDIVHGRVAIEGPDGQLRRVQHTRRWRVLRYLTTPFKHPAMFVTRRCYDRVGTYDTRFVLAADYDFMLRAIRAGVEDCYVPEVLTTVRAVGATTGTAEISGVEELRAIMTEYAGSRLGAELLLVARRVHRALRRRKLREWGLAPNDVD